MGTNVIYLAEMAARLSALRFTRPRRAGARYRLPSDAAPPTVVPPRVGDETPYRDASGNDQRVHEAPRPSGNRAAPTVRVPEAPGADTTRQGHPVVRVVHLCDAGDASSAGMGRLRISGRLVDVCAELERLVQAEALAPARAATRARRA